MLHEAVTWSGTENSARSSLPNRNGGKPVSSSSSSTFPPSGFRGVFSVQLQAPQPWASGSKETLWSQASVGGGKRACLQKGPMGEDEVKGRPGKASNAHFHTSTYQRPPWVLGPSRPAAPTKHLKGLQLQPSSSLASGP